MTKLLVDAVGWLGAILLLLAYGLVSFRRMRPDSPAYQALNGFGSLGLIVNTFYYRAYPSAFVNLVWITIALIAGVRLKGRAAYASRQEPSTH